VLGVDRLPAEKSSSAGETRRAGARRVADEGLDVVTGLMSGRPFSYEGRHFNLDGVEFAPQPVQRPRVPIWVAGTWPYRKPFRRAARYDGVVPIARDPNEVEIMVDVATMRDIVAYTDEHRTDDGTFDRVFTGYLPEDQTEASSLLGTGGRFDPRSP
jgi:alkanesulfonate monooxygenase SsuD/methylene tetrahydromethanopterin reductase-like flavin-dependent oxidoreductase (luciferase family)